MKLFRLVWYNTKSENKFDVISSDQIHEYLGNVHSIFSLYYLIKDAGFTHVEVYNFRGNLMDMTKGVPYLATCA
jgi:hypothetical protein